MTKDILKKDILGTVKMFIIAEGITTLLLGFGLIGAKRKRHYHHCLGGNDPYSCCVGNNLDMSSYKRI